LALLDNIDYIKLNFLTMPDNTLRNIIEIAHGMNKQCVAMGINNEELYQKAMSMKVDALEGSHVAEKMSSQTQHTSGYLQSNFFRLIVAITQEEPNLDEIVQLISVDATLTYGLLRVVNSSYFALRHRATTVHQAIMTLGISQLKQWIYLLSASNVENEFDTGSEDFLKLSFMRANFCSELMNYAGNMPISKSDAYLMGMFSTLNHLIDSPLEDILEDLPILEEVKRALIYHEGRAGLLYDLTLSYERADWNEISVLAAQLGIASNLLTTVYFNCMEEVNSIWKQLTNPSADLIDSELEPVAP
jgi:EAL and modified HD-GYP domain-containing signal transduction protein